MGKVVAITAGVLMGTGAWAQTWNCGSPNEADVIATLDSIQPTLTISGKGKMKDSPSFGSYSYIITTIVIEQGVTSIGDWTFAFSFPVLTSVTIPASVTSIGEYAFVQCSALASVTIPEGVTSIGFAAFNNCDALTSVAIPASVTSIGGAAFSACNGLTSINVAATNANYVSDNDVLFDKAKTTLIQYPAGKMETSYIIPNNITSIGEFSFDDCRVLVSIIIPEGVTSIGYAAFSGCTGLTSITIPEAYQALIFTVALG
jgi:hypothetical protein